MALQIIEPNQPIPVGAINVLVYGQPGTGKSSLGYTTRRPLVLDFDNGAHRSRQSSLGRTVRIDTWADITELMKSGIIDGHDTIVIDTVGRALDYISAWLVSTNPKLGTSRGLSMQGWGELKAVFTQWLKAINVLGKDVVMVAHGKEEKEGDNIRKRPDVAGGSYAEVMKVADFIGYVHMAEGKRAIGFAPTDDWIGKDSAGLGKVYVPDFGETPTYGGDLLASMRRAFGELTQSQREAVETVTTWRDTIEGIDDVDGINNAIPSIVALDEPMRSQVKTVLNKRAKALGLTWDKAANAYVGQEVAA